ncbi:MULTISPECIES: ATP-dependent DNA ligase [unclassified Streptomyces]|uniref:ATP-dependent DNA ligase n=1 Tax=unclassified Streptomyces TaxID=2593676 RepID=UPI00339DCE77
MSWLDPAWGTAGVEGVVIKDPGSRYRPGARGWQKLRTRTTAEGIIGAVTGTVHAPKSLLLGRLDPTGRLQLIARSTTLSRPASAELSAALRPAGQDHPWHGRRFSAGWGASEPLVFQPVVPDLVAEIDVDTAVDLGTYRHPVRFLRPRDDVASEDV